MDSTWTLELLSNRGLDQSILLTVLIGLWLMLAFSEVLGWVFIGVVVPGYLASVMVIAPTSACAILCEAIVTLVLARTLAVSLAKTGVWTQFFGRDRFFLIVLISVWVRQLSQSVALPSLENFLRNHGYPSLTLTEDFSSIGLVLVPLTANMFWRLNLARGLLHFGTLVGLTYALLRWILLPYTNLTDASLVLLYEDSAIDFMSNAKSYIVLLISAYIASVANLKYGWDFGGILIAALLSLLWWTPLKLALTLLEAMLLYGATLVLLKLPLIRTMNLEGSRKISVVFTYAFCLKCLIGITIGDSFPGLKVTDLFAFGYLMSSILVVRMMVVGSARRVMLPVVLTSVVGFVLSSIMGLWIAQLSNRFFAPPPPRMPARIVSKRALQTPQGVLGYASSKRSQSRRWHDHDRIKEQKQQHLFWKRLAAHLKQPDQPFSWEQALSHTRLYHQKLLTQAGQRPTHLIHPGETKYGNPYDGPIVLFREHSHGPIMVVHWPEREPGLAQAAWIECERNDCGALVLIGEHAKQVERGLSPKKNPQEKQLLRDLRRSRPIWHVVFAQDVDSGQKSLHLDSSHAEAYAFLRDDLEYHWNQAPEAKILDALPQDRVLRLSSADQFTQISSHWDLAPKHLKDTGLYAYLERHRKLRADSSRGLSTTTPEGITSFSATELRILEQRIVGPLLTISNQPEPSPERLASINFWSRPLGIDVNWLPSCAQLGCFVLTVDDPLQGLVWALAHQSQNQDDIEIPRPQREMGTLGLGLALFQAHSLRSLLVHTGDWRYDPTFMGHIHTAYQAIHQSLDRHSKDSVAVILRGLKSDPESEAQHHPQRKDPVLIGLGYPLLNEIERSGHSSKWIKDQGPLGFLGPLYWSDASLEHYRYSGAQIPQVRYSRILGKKQPMVAWLSSKTRSPYAHRSATHWRDLAHALDAEANNQPFLTQDLDLKVIDEHEFLVSTQNMFATCAHEPSTELEVSKRWDELLDHAERVAQYRHSYDLFSLLYKVKSSRDSSIALVRGARSGTVFLAISWKKKRRIHRALVTLGEAKKTRSVIEQSGSDQVGPWPSLAMAQLRRHRTLVSIHCI